jgi:hypothetical protein
MLDRPGRSERARDLLALVRTDRASAELAVARLPIEEQLALVCEAPVSRRQDLLQLLPEPERVIPLLPEAELCFTVKAVGLADATWILEYATPDQIVACLDLDAWRGVALERTTLDAWLTALAQTDDEAFAKSALSLDPELLVLYLKDRIDVFVKPPDSEDTGWQPPPGAQTLDGVFHFAARRDDDDLATIVRLFHLLFERSYWSYFRLVQGAVWELTSDTEEWALRWRASRLLDLGFPPWEEAMSVYRFVRPIALLDEKERRAAFFAFVAVANKVAVADRLDLADAESTPRAIEKAARWISRGLEFVARERALGPDEVLRRLPLERLFRVGASLDPQSARP